MKKCNKCNILLSFDNFYKDINTKDGYKCRCKICYQKYKNIKKINEWKKNNKNKIIEKRLNNKEYYKEYMRKYRLKDKYIEYNKEYWKWYRIKNHATRLQYSRMYFNTYIGKENNRLYASKRRKLAKLTDDWTINYKNTQSLLKKQNNKCNMCWCELNLSYWITRKIDWKHIDHIIPLSKWWRHSIDNIQWLCYKCNMSKSNKLF